MSQDGNNSQRQGHLTSEEEDIYQEASRLLISQNDPAAASNFMASVTGELSEELKGELSRLVLFHLAF